jgi:hypothetical protein
MANNEAWEHSKADPTCDFDFDYEDFGNFSKLTLTNRIPFLLPPPQSSSRCSSEKSRWTEGHSKRLTHAQSLSSVKFFQPEKLTPVSHHPVEEFFCIQEDPVNWTAKTPSNEASVVGVASTSVSEAYDSVETDRSDGEPVLQIALSTACTTDIELGNPWHEMDDGDERFNPKPGTSLDSDANHGAEERFFDAEE